MICARLAFSIDWPYSNANERRISFSKGNDFVCEERERTRHGYSRLSFELDSSIRTALYMDAFSNEGQANKSSPLCSGLIRSADDSCMSECTNIIINNSQYLHL